MKTKQVLWFLLIIALVSGCAQSPPVTATALSSPTTPPPTATVTNAPTATATPLVPHRGPYLVMTSDPTSLKVCWQFDPPADAVLAWGLDSAYSAGSISLPAGVSGDISCAVMTGLQTATHYLYRLTSRGAEYISSFTTPPAETATDLIFWGYGDTQSNADIHDAIDASILKEMGDDPSRQTFVFNTGDIMNEASEESLQANQFDSQWVHITGLYSRVPVVNVMGNHDGTKLFIKYFPYPYTSTFDWSFDYGPAHFVVIDLYSGTDPNSPRWQWMRDDLASSTKPWKFILVHEPGWSAGPHENNEVVQKIIHPAAVKYGVAIVFSGHNHYFARAEVDGVTYITTGGGGSELYDPEYNWPDIQKTIKANHYLRVEIKGSLLTVTVLSPQEVQLDQFQLTK